MAGRGKNGKSTTKSAAKRQTHKAASKQLPGGIITNGAIRRLARRGGVKRIAFSTHHEVRGYIDQFLEKLVGDSLTFAEHAKRLTITAMDVVYALKKNGRVLYGYGV
jgi:histone H3/H4